MNSDITIVTNNIEGFLAPLYHKYDGQWNAQTAYIEVDTEERTVTADCNPEIGNGVPERVFNGIVIRINVPNNVDGDSLASFMNENASAFEFICDSIDVEWDGSDNVGVVNDEEAVNKVIYSLEQDAEELECVNIYYAADYIAQCPLECNWPAGMTLAETIEDIEMNVDGIIEGNLEEVLLLQALYAYNDRENVTKEQYAALLDNELVEEPVAIDNGEICCIQVEEEGHQLIYSYLDRSGKNWLERISSEVFYVDDGEEDVIQTIHKLNQISGATALEYLRKLKEPVA